MRKHSKKLRGSTLLEVMISLLITTFCIALTIMILLNIQKSATPFFKLKAIELCNSYLSRSLKERNSSDLVFEEDGFIIKRVTGAHGQFIDRSKVKIIVMDQDMRILYEAEQVK